MKSFQARLMLIMGYLGAVVGAGFASGQEIVQFFVTYGALGWRGTILALVMFMVCGGLLLNLAHRVQVSNYQSLLTYIMGEKLGIVVDFLLAIFLFLGISTMLSASGAVFYEHLYLPKTIGVFLAYLLVGFFLLSGKKGMIYSYNFLVPVKLILFLLVSGYAALFFDRTYLEMNTVVISSHNIRSWGIASLLYVAYNFALAMVVLIEYQSVTARRDGVIGAVWGGIILGILVMLNYTAMFKFLPAVLEYEVPMLYVAGKISITAKLVYTLMLWLGIITTAIAYTYGFAQRLSNFTGLKYGLCLIMSITLALPLGMQDFSILVGRIYPVFGILGVFILAGLIGKSAQDIGKEIYYNIGQLWNAPRR